MDVVRVVHADLERERDHERGGETPELGAAGGRGPDDDRRDAGAQGSGPRAAEPDRRRLTAASGTSRSPGRASRRTRRGPPAPPPSCNRGASRRPRVAGCRPARRRPAFEPAFSIRSASGLIRSISRHHRTVSASRSSSGTTAFTRPHSSAVVGVVLTAQEPDLLRALLSDLAGEQVDPVAAVERPDPRAGLAEPRVVGRDREVAAHVQHVAAADRVAGHHRDDGLREPADLDLEVEHVQPADRRARRRTRRRRGSAGRRRCRTRRAPRPVRMTTPIAGIVARDVERVRQLADGRAVGTRCAPRAGRS